MNRKEEALTFSASDINPLEAYVPRKNKSCFFILPLLGYPSYWYYGLINCYLNDKVNKPELKNKIFINLKNYDSKILKVPEFLLFYQLEDKSYMYVFNTPERFKEDYDRFTIGKYSKMSGEAKKLIIKLCGITPATESVVHKVLYKTNDQKAKIEELVGQKLLDTDEVYSVPDLDKETYSLFRIRNSTIVNEIEREESERG